MLALDPRVPVMARVNRAFMHRSTRRLAANGVRQFLDVGTGIPTEPNPHQVAQRIAPDARVVYCDNDPIVLAHAAALLRSTSEGVTEYLQADVRDPDAIIAGAGKILDLDRPVALSLVALLHFVSDEDGAHDLVDRLLAALPSGSCLMMTHATADFWRSRRRPRRNRRRRASPSPCGPARSSPASSTDSTWSNPASRWCPSGTPSSANRCRDRTTA